MGRIAAAAGMLVLAAATSHAAVPVTLGGSPESMVRQNRIARESAVTFFRTPQEVRAAAGSGELVAVTGDENLSVNRISFPYALPETRLFLERFSAQYHAACGEKLVVTSLTRPQSRQPANAHRLSVHPTGLAVDLRVSQEVGCRRYLETALLAKERDGVLDITRERNPPHYHVALFPAAYLEYIGESTADAPVRHDPDADGLQLDIPVGLDPVAVPAARALRPAGAGEGRMEEGRSWGGWIGRLLTLPVRLVGRVLGG